MEQITIKSEASKILQWLSRDGLCLKKNVLFVQQKGEKFIGSEVDIQDMEPSADIEFIGIPI